MKLREGIYLQPLREGIGILVSFWDPAYFEGRTVKRDPGSFSFFANEDFFTFTKLHW